MLTSIPNKGFKQFVAAAAAAAAAAFADRMITKIALLIQYFNTLMLVRGFKHMETLDTLHIIGIFSLKEPNIEQ